jgi:formylglycine-generating enzyme required for sulfatase activity
MNPPSNIDSPEQNQPVKVDYVNSIGMKFVRIPVGAFLMGTNSVYRADRINNEFHFDKDELPQHAATISMPFLMGVYEVTQKEFQDIMGVNPSWFSRSGKGSEVIVDCVRDRLLQSEDTSTHPVEDITWIQASEFCRKLSAKESKVYRLPTEAEWEYACRAGTSTPFSFGEDQNRLSQYAWTQSRARPVTVPVGRFSPNQYGLYDMHGNVFEFCNDWYDRTFYDNSTLTDPQGPRDGLLKVMRGGSFATYNGGSVNAIMGYRSAKRWSIAPNRRAKDVGFRILLEDNDERGR